MIKSQHKAAATVLALTCSASACAYNAIVLHGPGVPFSVSYGWGIGGGATGWTFQHRLNRTEPRAFVVWFAAEPN